jgi:hypothetical protein
MNKTIQTLTTAITLAVVTPLFAAEGQEIANRSATPGLAAGKVEGTVRELVGVCKGVFTAPLGEVLHPGADLAEKANGPLLGNGHVGVQLSGSPEHRP